MLRRFWISAIVILALGAAGCATSQAPMKITSTADVSSSPGGRVNLVAPNPGESLRRSQSPKYWGYRDDQHRRVGEGFKERHYQNSP